MHQTALLKKISREYVSEPPYSDTQARQTRPNSGGGGLQWASQDLTKGGGGVAIVEPTNNNDLH